MSASTVPADMPIAEALESLGHELGDHEEMMDREHDAMVCAFCWTLWPCRVARALAAIRAALAQDVTPPIGQGGAE